MDEARCGSDRSGSFTLSRAQCCRTIGYCLNPLLRLAHFFEFGKSETAERRWTRLAAGPIGAGLLRCRGRSVAGPSDTVSTLYYAWRIFLSSEKVKQRNGDGRGSLRVGLYPIEKVLPDA